MHLQRRTNELHLYGHRGLDEIITTQLRYSQSAPSFRIVFHRLSENVIETIYEDESLRVTTIPLQHKIQCSGFLFQEKTKPRRIDKSKLPGGLLIRQIADLKKGVDVVDEEGNILYSNESLTFPPRRSRSYAYCSDTAFSETVISQVNAVDVLYHEATFTQEDAVKARETLHSTAADAATAARMAGVDKLLLGHFSARYKDLTPLLDEARAIFPNSYLATEGEEITITD
jgi:ribonuclease Z